MSIKITDIVHNYSEKHFKEATNVLAELHKDHLSEVPSGVIGVKVTDKLYDIDPVAYVRYVSVYRQFEDVGEFIKEIQRLEYRGRKDPLQPPLFNE